MSIKLHQDKTADEATIAKMEKALDSGDSKNLAESLKEAHEQLVTSISCNFNKDLARAIIKAVEYQIPEAVTKTTNKAVAALEKMQESLKADGVTDKKVFESIQKQIAGAGQQITLSDGVQKGFQSLLVESLVYRLRNDKDFLNEKLADALEGATLEIIKYGARKTISKKKAKVAEESDEEVDTQKEAVSPSRKKGKKS